MSDWKPAEWLEAVPLDYLHESRLVGRCYAAIQKGPPLQVKEFEPAVDEESHAQCIVIEFEDLLSLGAKDLGFQGKTEDVLRIALQFPGARKLCYQLTAALAEAGDRVANRTLFALRQSMDSLKEEEDDGPEEDAENVG